MRKKSRRFKQRKYEFSLQMMNPGKFEPWASSRGFTNEIDYWKSFSGITSGCLSDHMNAALGAYGSGTIGDKLKSFLYYQTQATGDLTLSDLANRLFDNGDTLRRLQSFSNLTFYKDYAHSPTTLDADYSVGSGTATFTATRSAAAPATYVDSDGIIQLVTTSNVGRFQGGYYDVNGFTPQKGLMIEAAATNLLTRTDGTASGSGQWTNWASSGTTVTGTPTYSVPAIPELTSITNATSQRIQYVGVAGDTAQTLEWKSPTTAAASIVNGNTVTYSCYLRSQTGLSGVSLALRVIIRDSASVGLENLTGSDISGSITSQWKRFTFTGTTNQATADKGTAQLLFQGIADGDTIDIEEALPQLEIGPYATSPIPTTTASLTRGAETLSYVNLNNRTAASETIFIKFAPNSVFANDGIERRLHAADTKGRSISKNTTLTVLRYLPNSTDNGAVLAAATTTPQANTSYVMAGVCQHSSPYAEIYMNGTSEGTYTVGDFTDNAWGTNFYIGSNAGTVQLNGIIQAVGFYSDAKDATNVGLIENIFAIA